MRRQLLTLAAAVAAFVGLAVSAPGVAQADDTPSLSSCTDQLLIVGSSGPCVKSLQQSLLALPGFNNAFSATGAYGARTRLAVYYYQGWAGLQQDGQAGHITLSNLDMDANRPTPAGRPASLPAMPDRGATFSSRGDSVQTSSMAWVHTYYSRGTTRRLNDVLNSPNTSLAVGGSTLAICTAAGITSGELGGVACDGMSLAAGYDLQRAVNDAVNQNACLEVEVTNYGLGVVNSSFTVNGNNNCIP